jgi:DNA polymerase III epsilon subunit-like protein
MKLGDKGLLPSETLMPNLASLTLAFLDVETTGLSPWFGDRICEIAILRCRGEVILDTFETVVNPERPISPGANRLQSTPKGGKILAGMTPWPQRSRSY